MKEDVTQVQTEFLQMPAPRPKAVGLRTAQPARPVDPIPDLDEYRRERALAMGSPFGGFAELVMCIPHLLLHTERKR